MVERWRHWEERGTECGESFRGPRASSHDARTTTAARPGGTENNNHRRRGSPRRCQKSSAYARPGISSSASSSSRAKPLQHASGPIAPAFACATARAQFPGPVPRPQPKVPHHRPDNVTVRENYIPPAPAPLPSPDPPTSLAALCEQTWLLPLAPTRQVWLRF